MKPVLIICLLFSFTRANAQAEEITQSDDNARQLQYYLQQIAANAVMIKYIKEGINIARFGLNAIYTIKHKEFNLHDFFFKALRAINPRIKGLGTVAEIIDKETQIVRIYRSAFKRIRESGQFTEQEINYMFTVFNRLLDDTGSILDELIKVITANQYQFSDDERIARINALHTDMSSSYEFAQHFGHEALVLAVQRLQEKNETDKSRILFDLK